MVARITLAYFLPPRTTEREEPLDTAGKGGPGARRRRCAATIGASRSYGVQSDAS